MKELLFAFILLPYWSLVIAVTVLLFVAFGVWTGADTQIDDIMHRSMCITAFVGWLNWGKHIFQTNKGV